MVLFMVEAPPASLLAMLLLRRGGAGPALTRKVSMRRTGVAETRDRTGDLQIFGLTLSQLSYRGSVAARLRSSFGFAISNRFAKGTVAQCNLEGR